MIVCVRYLPLTMFDHAFEFEFRSLSLQMQLAEGFLLTILTTMDWVNLFRNCWIWPFKRENFHPQLAAVILGTVEMYCWMLSAVAVLCISAHVLDTMSPIRAARLPSIQRVWSFDGRAIFFSFFVFFFFLSFFLFFVTFFKTRDNEILNSKCPALPLIRYSINSWHCFETSYHVWLILILAYFNQSSCVDIFSVQLF